jgi:hypothetical protein
MAEKVSGVIQAISNKPEKKTVSLLIDSGWWTIWKDKVPLEKLEKGVSVSFEGDNSSGFGNIVPGTLVFDECADTPTTQAPPKPAQASSQTGFKSRDEVILLQVALKEASRFVAAKSCVSTGNPDKDLMEATDLALAVAQKYLDWMVAKKQEIV